MKNKKTVILFLILILINLFTVNIIAADVRLNNVIFDRIYEENAILEFDIIKHKEASYGLEFVATNKTDNVEGFSNYSTNGMIRLTADNNLVMGKAIGWINADGEGNTSFIRVPFEPGVWHTVKMILNRNPQSPVVEWYLDGEFVAEIPARTPDPCDAISIFGESADAGGCEIKNVKVYAFEAPDKPGGTVATYNCTYKESQGVKNWYYCEFGSSAVYNMKHNGSDRWKGTYSKPYIAAEQLVTGDNECGYHFVSPKKGMALIKGKVNLPFEACAMGDGITARIYKENRLLWSSHITYGTDGEYNFLIPLEKGDNLYFKAGKRNDDSYDWTRWWPSVLYTNAEYIPDTDENTYYEKNGDVKIALQYSDEDEGYVSSDGNSVLCRGSVSLHNKTVLGRSYVTDEDGRYRVYGEITPLQGAVVLRILKNNEYVWKQMFPNGEKGTVDFRLMTQKGDDISLEFEGVTEEAADVSVSINTVKYVGTLFAHGTTVAGHNFTVNEEYTFSEFMEKAEKDGRASYYSVKNDLKYPMEFNGGTLRWEQNIPVSENYKNARLTYSEVKGYISPGMAGPGALNETTAEFTVEKAGVIRIYGRFGISDAGDGVVCGIYHNDRQLWSSRVGGERVVRWDEPFDISYFSPVADVVMPVKKGDVFKFTFNQWRKPVIDDVDLSDIKISYVSGDILSETTKWKLSKSIVVDGLKKLVYADGIASEADVYVKDGELYMAKKELENLLGKSEATSRITINKKEYVPLCETVISEGKNVLWEAERIAVIYDGVPTLFGYGEASEINTVANPNYNIWNMSEIVILDADGKNVGEFEKGETYKVGVTSVNYTGEDVGVRIIAAQYKGNDRLVDISLSEEIKVLQGNVSYAEDNLISFTANKNADNIKLFAWDGFNELKPVCKLTVMKIKN